MNTFFFFRNYIAITVFITQICMFPKSNLSFWETCFFKKPDHPQIQAPDLGPMLFFLLSQPSRELRIHGTQDTQPKLISLYIDYSPCACNSQMPCQINPGITSSIFLRSTFLRWTFLPICILLGPRETKGDIFQRSLVWLETDHAGAGAHMSAWVSSWY